MEFLGRLDPQDLKAPEDFKEILDPRDQRAQLGHPDLLVLQVLALIGMHLH